MGFSEIAFIILTIGIAFVSIKFAVGIHQSLKEHDV